MLPGIHVCHVCFGKGGAQLALSKHNLTKPVRGRARYGNVPSPLAFRSCLFEK